MILGFTEEHGLPLDVVQDGYLFLVRDERRLGRLPARARSCSARSASTRSC